ncbi:Rieske 2Fe-2S domain-containing protein [Streptomyces sp. JJ66]|uniref:Rieske 2Fe-2S domain-containing protein n=1 Tax=Streptomyces sp. JJ66 TaxID=2803843 RepID=UPI001C5A07F2|nr:Rieske 2Fe-2S domain-containing protein [Streptomyces sp. JJ66]MBW1600780.1 Rieske 2Fe-2S domain-containing protein [Streptomyces sp. JJ66]
MIGADGSREELQTVSAPAAPPNPAGANIAASWYAAIKSSRLGKGPHQMRLFGREVVLWRDRKGVARCVAAHCPHQGANLGLGDVVKGELRCPFHHWRFDGNGVCSAIPGLSRPPTTARISSYPTREAYGFVWVWYGTAEPLFELPEFPALTERPRRYLGFTYDDGTSGTVRQLLENAVDHQHFSALHGLALEEVDFRVLAKQSEAADNGPPLTRDDAWFGVWFSGRPWRPPLRRSPLGWITGVVSTFAMGRHMQLLVDGWPGGQRFTAYVDGTEVYKVIMGIVPEGDRATRQVGWAGVRRTGSWHRTLFNYVLFWVQNRAGTFQDVPVYDSTRNAQPTVYVRYDNGLLRFRRYYQSWVDRATDEGKAVK